MIKTWNTLSLSHRAGVFRILFFGLFLYFIKFFYLVSFSNFSQMDVYCSETMGVWYYLDLSRSQLSLLAWACIIGAVFACAGLFTRLSYFVVFISFLLLNACALKYCYFNHLYMPLHIPLLFWGLLDGQSGYRLDRLIFKTKKLPEDEENKRIEFFVKCNRVFFVVVFFATGLAKLKTSGFNWIFSDSMMHMLNLQNFASDRTLVPDFFHDINSWLIANPMICIALAFMTVFIEILAPIALFSHRGMKFIVFHLVLMQIGIYVTMYINFFPWFLIYLCWLPLLKVEPTFKVKTIKL